MLGVLAAGIATRLALTYRRGVARIQRLSDSTVIDDDGAVRSIQAADVTLPASELDRLWSPMYLESLARTYWRFLTRTTLGLIRVKYTERERYVCLLFRPLVLLSFQAPEYDVSATRGVVRWRIEPGGPRSRHALSHRVARPRLGQGPRRERLPGDRRRAPPGRPARRGARARRGRGGELLSRPRALDQPLGVRQHPVARPRDRHPGLPGLPGAHRPLAGEGRGLRAD